MTDRNWTPTERSTVNRDERLIQLANGTFPDTILADWRAAWPEVAQYVRRYAFKVNSVDHFNAVRRYWNAGAGI